MRCGVSTTAGSGAHICPPPPSEHTVRPHLDPAHCLLGLHHAHVFGGGFVWEELGGAQVIGSKNDSIDQVLRVTGSRNCNTQSHSGEWSHALHPDHTTSPPPLTSSTGGPVPETPEQVHQPASLEHLSGLPSLSPHLQIEGTISS